jgi:hypothetical protein
LGELACYFHLVLRPLVALCFGLVRFGRVLFALPEFLNCGFLIACPRLRELLLLFALAGPAPTAADAATNASSTSLTNEMPTVDPFFMLSGALLKDNFDGPQLDTNLWSRPGWLVENHRTIGAKIENGHLVISGSSRPAGGSHQYAGVISKYFRETDVVLAAEMQVRSPFEGRGRIQHMVHLCSGTTRIFSLKSFSARSRMPRHHVGTLPISERFGSTQVTESTLNQPVLRATRKQLDGTPWCSLTTERLRRPRIIWCPMNGGTPIGPSHSVRFNHTHIELKVDVKHSGRPSADGG